MSSSSVTSSSSSTDSILLDPYREPLINPKNEEKETKTNWIKIGGIAVAILGALVTGCAVLCFMEIFPIGLLGGQVGAGITGILGLALLLPSAYVVYKYWSLPSQES